jgi:hypothetical protein
MNHGGRAQKRHMTRIKKELSKSSVQKQKGPQLSRPAFYLSNRAL